MTNRERWKWSFTQDMSCFGLSTHLLLCLAFASREAYDQQGKMEVGLYTGHELFLLWCCSRRHSHIFRDCPRTQQFYSCVWRHDSLCLLLSMDIAAWFSRLHDFECMLCHASSSTQVLFIGLWWLWKWQNEGVFWDVCCILSSQLSYFKVQLA
ncbi:hypothetical protein MANES_08G088111v8 [Manihot esculenta]|uniref:Uncharacterized protein n=1 Tax=Manihot esculenta TaxID=3983 RepID=A0ACB7HBP7_MANES|nr:hypothetical protein MANES_08G088111v8 [Manihot esculenta]